MGIKAVASSHRQQSSQPRKRLNRLKSVRVANLDRLRLSMKQSKTRLSDGMIVPPCDDDDDYDVQDPLSTWVSPPNYMRDTTCSSARKGSSLPHPTTTTADAASAEHNKPFQRMKRVSSSKNLKKKSSFGKYTRRPSEEAQPVMRTMPRLRSIKLTRLTSVKLSSRRLSISTFGSTSLSSPVSDSQASIVKQHEDVPPIHASRLRTLRTLSRSRSLRSRRRVEKKRSRNARTRFDQATCSSTLRSTNISKGVVDLVPTESEPQEQPMLHVCPYSYCSVHGNKRAALPSMKSFVAAKRRALKKQKSKSVRQEYIIITQPTTPEILEEQECQGEHGGMNNIGGEADYEGGSDGMKISMREMQRTIHAGDTKEVKTTVGGEIEATVPQSVPIMISLKPELLNVSPSPRHVREPAKAKQETEELNELSNQSPATDSQVESGDSANRSLLLGRENTPNMWDLIFSHYLQPGSEQLNEVVGKEQGGPDRRDSSPSHHENKHDSVTEDGDEDADKENLNLNQDEALQLAQEAVDELLRLDGESADCQPVTPLQRDSHALEPCDSSPTDPVGGHYEKTNEKENKSASASACAVSKISEEVNEYTSGPGKADSKEGKLLERQASKGLAKLRKMIITAKSVKAMEKLMKIKSRKPQTLSSVASAGTNKTLLSHHSMKSTSAEELMLDYALRQVIAKLDPAQQRRVTLLIEAFETISPELQGKGMRSNPRRLQIANYTASESTYERDEGPGIKFHPSPSMLSDKGMKKLDVTTSTFDANDSMSPLASNDGMPDGEMETQIGAAAPTSDELCEHSITKPSKENHEELHRGEDAQAAESLPICKIHTRECDEDNEASNRTLNFLDSAQKVHDSSAVDSQISLAANQGNNRGKENLQKSLGSEVLGEQFRMNEGANGAREIPHQNSLGGSEFNRTISEGTGLEFDKQKFTNVWNMVYRHFVASDPSESENKQDLDSAGKEQDGDLKNIRPIDRSDSGTSQNGLNQADAFQLVQEAIDELLRLQGQLSDQQSISAHNVQTSESNGEKIHEMEPSRIRDQNEGNTRSGLDGMQTEPEVESKEQDPAQAHSSKAYGKLKSLMVSTRFIKAMQNLRKISPKRGQNLSLKADTGPERVYLRHLSMDERRNHEEWMFDYALQQVLAKMDPSQQRKVAMLTQLFESVNPEIQKMNAKQRPSSMQSTNSGNHRENEGVMSEVDEKPTMNQAKVQHLEDKVQTLAQRSSSNAQEQSVLLSREHHGNGTTVLHLNEELYKDGVELEGVNLHLHHINGSTEGCPICYPESAFTIGEEKGANSTTEHKPHKLSSTSEDTGQCNNTDVTQDKLRGTDYSKVWNLIYQQVKSRAAGDTDEQSDEAASKEMQVNSSTSGTGKESEGTCHVGLGLTQSDVIKVVQEALEGILKQSHLDQKTSKEDEDTGVMIDNFNHNHYSHVSTKQEEDRFNQGTISGSEEDGRAPEQKKSTQKALQPYSRWKRALICSRFVKAMEKMQKFHPQRRSNGANESSLGPEVVNLRKCLLDDRSLKEEWMFDFALQQVIAKLAPAQQKRVTMLVEAFEIVAPTGQDGTSKQPCRWNSEPSKDVSANRNEVWSGIGDGQVLGDKTLQDNHEEGQSEAGETIRTGTSRKARETVIGNVLDNQKSIDSGVAVSNTMNAQPEDSIETHHLVENSHTVYGSMKDSSESEDLDGDNSTKEGSDILASNQSGSTSMWKLIRKHLDAGRDQGMEEQIPGQPAADKIMVEERVKVFHSCQSSTETYQDDSEEAQDNNSRSIDDQQAEAIKMVQAAVDEILHTPEPTRDDQSADASSTPKHEDFPSDEKVGMQEGENEHDKLARSYSAMSKIILCNKFIKAMEKMKKTPSRRRWSMPRQTSLDAEIVTLKPQTTSDKNYEEWMLDIALQQVVRKLGPAQKKKVSALVDAFEKFSPSPDTRANQRLKTLAR